MSADTLVGIPYRRSEGPIEPHQILDPELQVEQANCQRAAQLWYFRIHGMILPPEDVLSAESFLDTRAVVVENLEASLDPDAFISKLSFGDLVHAERKKTAAKYKEWTFDRQKNLHVAVFAGIGNSPHLQEHFPLQTTMISQQSALFFHGTNGGTRFTPVDEFLQEYTLIQARRIPSLKQEYQTIYQST